MPTYMSLVNWTQRGIESIKESPNRLDAAKEAYRAAGAEIREFYLAMGRYDGVFIIDAPDDETLEKLSLATRSQGSVRSEVLRVFTEDEYRKIISDLP